ncbi:MAG: deoxyribodipyrimidine photo-lyase, partial [Cytophagales bacterium]|nr:deoxyribodipyrimidine photo-lyase [Cytophagales bacterium]
MSKQCHSQLVEPVHQNETVSSMQSNSNKPKINIVWFKRDLRLSDHQPLCHAIEDGSPVLLLAFLEPSLMKAPQSDTRHWRFVYQSIQD